MGKGNEQRRANVGDQPSGMDQRAYANSKGGRRSHSALATTGYVVKAETARQSQSSRGIVDTYRESQRFSSGEFRPGY